jgi:MFS family permease
MLAIMTVAAFFLNIAWDPYMALIADLFPPAQRGRVGGFLGVAAGFGTILLYLLAYLLWEHNEFIVFAVTVVLLLGCFAFTVITVKEPPVDAQARPQSELDVKPNPLQYIRELRHYPEATKYVLFTTLYWMGAGGAIPFVTLFGEHALHASVAESFLLPIGATLMMALCAVPWGILADRKSKKLAMSAGLLIFGLASLVGSQSQTLWQGIIALAVVGIGNSATTLINPMLTDLVPRKRVAEFVGLGSAVFSFAQPLGSVLVGGIVGLMAGVIGLDDAYRWAFVCAGAMVLLAAVLLQTVHPERVVDED